MLLVVVVRVHADSMEDWKSDAVKLGMLIWLENYFLPLIYPASYRLRSGAGAVCHVVILISRGRVNAPKRFLRALIL